MEQIACRRPKQAHPRMIFRRAFGFRNVDQRAGNALRVAERSLREKAFPKVGQSLAVPALPQKQLAEIVQRIGSAAGIPGASMRRQSFPVQAVRLLIIFLLNRNHAKIVSIRALVAWSPRLWYSARLSCPQASARQDALAGWQGCTGCRGRGQCLAGLPSRAEHLNRAHDRCGTCCSLRSTATAFRGRSTLCLALLLRAAAPMPLPASRCPRSAGCARTRTETALRQVSASLGRSRNPARRRNPVQRRSATAQDAGFLSRAPKRSAKVPGLRRKDSAPLPRPAPQKNPHAFGPAPPLAGAWARRSWA